jgi:hypothetical protein
MNREERSAYDLNRYYAKRQQALIALGASCAVCGSMDDLELDHIDPKTKKFDLSRSWGRSDFLEELQKCQILCKSHHEEKTLREGDGGRFRARHGTYYMYRHYKCRCLDCVNAERQQRKNWGVGGKVNTSGFHPED